MTTLLLDADGLVYKLAYRHQDAVDWDDDGDPLVWTNPGLAKADLGDYVDDLAHDLGANRVVMCLSDPDRNWRHDVMKTYKANRAPEDRPVLWAEIRKHIEDNFETWLRPRLEADDVMGILATNPKIIKDEKIVATIDKDLKTVPGLFYDLNHPDDGVQEISPAEAEAFHLKQALAGDPVDHYYGAIGVGWSKASDMVDDFYRGEGWHWEAYEHEFKRGPRKGLSETRWCKVPSKHVWGGILTWYRKVGMTAMDALANAQVARILRHGEYDYYAKEPIYWTPRRIEHEPR